MSLQKRLTYLLIAFASFALLAAFGTIYAIELQVDDAVESFARSMDHTHWLEHLRLDIREQHAELWEIIEGRRRPDESYLARQENLFAKLTGAMRSLPPGEATTELAGLGSELEPEFNRCLTLTAASQQDQARIVLADRIEGDLLPAVDACLQRAKGVLNEARRLAVDNLVATNTQVLVFSVVVGVFGAALVAVGTALIRRWVIMPIRSLETATGEFSRGNLGFRLDIDSADELGALAMAMNTMAGSLTDAQADLQVSEAKYRSLFENLRDAVVICDAAGRVVECHDGDTELLGGVTCGRPGRPLLEIWPHWRTDRLDWLALIRRVLAEGTQARAANIELGRTSGSAGPAVVDLIAYPVEFADARYVAIVLRDVTERRRLEDQARRAEAMGTAITFARGVAHDFNNLLTGTISTLSLVRNQAAGRMEERIHRALRACWQAAGLSRKLLEFAGGGRGHPQTVCLSETIDLILGSFEESFFEGVRVHADLDDSVFVRIDPDQLTQIVLNLVRNAREAMPDGGDLHIKLGFGQSSQPLQSNASADHAVLTVTDTGQGMTPEARARLFEPFFSTKDRGARRSRGMGLAIVYAAVKNAGGLIEVDSHPGTGTTFRVLLPVEQDAIEDTKPHLATATPTQDQSGGTILLVDSEPMILQACADALVSWGYSVITTASAAEARCAFASGNRAAVFLAIIDMSLPDDAGIALAHDLVAAEPGLRLVFSTGFSDEQLPDDLEDKVCARLTKPFRLDALSTAVSAALSPLESP